MSSESSQPRVVVLGGINSDYTIRAKKLPEPGQSVRGETFLAGPGGKGANQAVAAARLGARVSLIGRVGDEPRGRQLVQGLRRETVSVRHVSLDLNTATGAAIIAVNQDGEKQIAAALGANHTMKPAQIAAAEALIAGASALLCNFEAPPQCVLAAARLAAKHGVKVVLDPAPPVKISPRLFKLLYAIRPNADEARQITGVTVKDRATAREAGRKLLAKGVKVAVLEAGSSGNLILSQQGEWFLPRLKVKTVDATGAGDAFAAGFTVGLSENLPLNEAARLATATAALSTTRLGAQEALPSRAEVDRLLRKKK